VTGRPCRSKRRAAHRRFRVASAGRPIENREVSVRRSFVSGLVIAASIVAAVAQGVSPAAASTTLFAPKIPTTNRLITNEYAYWNPTHTDAIVSPDWQMTSGSLFARDGNAWSGHIDRIVPNATSSNGTDSAVFRLNTKRKDFGNVAVRFTAKVISQGSTSATPPVAWDGIHIWLRYQSQYGLYVASVARRDGHIVIKKKCPGGTTNGGTYYELSSEVKGYPITLGQWRDVGATVANRSDGSVRITMLLGGQYVLGAVDHGVGCAPITTSGAIGIRGDNTEFAFTHFVVGALTTS
jgi:hypothetical protein